MRRALLVASAVMLLCFLAAPVRADYDPVLEAEEAAARAAQKAKSDKRAAEAQAARRNAENEAYRKFLGKDAEGKTDSEVRALAEAKSKNAQADAVAKQSEAFKLMADAQKSNSQADQLMKQSVGRSFSQIQGMSPEQLEALAEQMEKTHLKGMEE